MLNVSSTSNSLNPSDAKGALAASAKSWSAANTSTTASQLNLNTRLPMGFLPVTKDSYLQRFVRSVYAPALLHPAGRVAALLLLAALLVCGALGAAFAERGDGVHAVALDGDAVLAWAQREEQFDAMGTDSLSLAQFAKGAGFALAGYAAVLLICLYHPLAVLLIAASSAAAPLASCAVLWVASIPLDGTAAVALLAVGVFAGAVALHVVHAFLCTPGASRATRVHKVLAGPACAAALSCATAALGCALLAAGESALTSVWLAVLLSALAATTFVAVSALPALLATCGPAACAAADCDGTALPAAPNGTAGGTSAAKGAASPMSGAGSYVQLSMPPLRSTPETADSSQQLGAGPATQLASASNEIAVASSAGGAMQPSARLR